jgi:hypothetical protein
MKGIGRTKSLNKISDTHYLKGTGHRIAEGGDQAMEAGVVGPPDDVQRSLVIRVRETDPSMARVRGDAPGGGRSRGDVPGSGWS